MRADVNERKLSADAFVFRPTVVVVLAFVCAVVCVVAFTLVGLFLRTSDTGVVFQLADQIAMFGIGVILGIGSLLFARPRVRADTQRVEVRNTFTTRTFEWSEVLAVSFPDGASWARLELPDDEYYPILAVQAIDRYGAVDAVRMLRRLHRESLASS